jgi:Na+/melibiose symporter-like transporter
MQKEPRPKQSQLCPCGSGKKYKQCCAVKKERRRRALRRSKTLLIWIGVVAGLVLLVYGVSQMSGVAFSDADLGVIDFSALDQSQKRAALRAANQARCPCGCGMTLAQCVATDSTCPLRTKNIDRIRAMVVEHGKPRSSS